jgi:hypothetical protein
MRGNKAAALWASCLVLALAANAPAASSLSNSLTGFTGDSSLVPTQTALAAAGFEFASTAGLSVDTDPRIVFDANGAAFGSLFVGNEGRNYMRTIEDDYAFADWTAYVTIVMNGGFGTDTTVGTNDTFFGMGSGDVTNWGTPDWFGVPTVFVAPQQGRLSSNANDGITGDWYTPPPCTQGWCGVNSAALVGETPGTHRLRMTFDFDTKTWVGSIDIDYAGGPFTADVSTLTYTLTDMFDDGVFVNQGWPSNPSRIYFGGDDGVIFKDFVVTVEAEGLPGDYNNDGNVDSADYVAWRKDPASFGGDPDGYNTWRTNFGTMAGGGSGVPEPTSMVLLLGVLIGLAVGRGVRIG